MKIKSFIKQSLIALQIVLCISLSILVSSCEKDEHYIGEVEIPKEVNLMDLNQYSYEIPFEIKSDTDWEISFDCDGAYDICYAYPNKGNGNATVTLCVVDNWTDTRRSGEMYIKFPKDPSKDQVIKLSQQSNLDNPDNDEPSEIKIGNRVVAVGYGYNFMGEVASANSVSLNPIVKIGKILNSEKDKDRINTGAMDASFEVKTYTGSSVSELMNELNTEAKFKGKYFRFKGEVGATFGMKNFNNKNNEYAITNVEVAKKYVYLEMDRNEIIADYMTDSAYEAINGLPHTGKRGTIPTSYPTTENGLLKLIQDYGTHLILKARLGGKLKYRMTVDVSKVSGNYDLKAYAACSYKNKFINTSASVSDNLQKSFEKNSKACEIKLLVKGGSESTVTELVKPGGNNDDNIEKWLTSLQSPANLTLVGLDIDDGVIPLYDLIDMSKDGSQQRYDLLKAIIEGDDISKAQALQTTSEKSLKIEMNYETGTVGHIASIPTFDESDGKTLIKDIYIAGQLAAQVCREYIPVLNQKERVTVVYPVLNNVPKYNMGFFIGDAGHKPAKICVTEEKTTVQNNTTKTVKFDITECSDEPVGAKTELYFRGSNCNYQLVAAEGGNEKSNDAIVETSTEDSYLNTKNYNGETVEHNYPLVKIFNNIWTRADYYSTIQSTGWSVSNKTVRLNNILYYNYNGIVDVADYPATGWEIPASYDYKAIAQVLDNSKISAIGNEFLSSGRLGFNAPLNGWVVGWKAPYEQRGYGVQAEYFTSDFYHIRIVNNGSFGVDQFHTDEMGYYKMSLRLIKKQDN